jgi:hypothetical protein
MYARIAGGLGGLLVAFHAWLFASHAWAGRFAEPDLVLRWLLAGGVVAALATVYRAGGSLVWGRRPVAIWLLAALLHGPAVAKHAVVDLPALPESVATVFQAAATSLIAGLGLALLALLTGCFALASGARLTAVPVRGPATANPVGSLALAPRPPPSRPFSRS